MKKILNLMLLFAISLSGLIPPTAASVRAQQVAALRRLHNTPPSKAERYEARDAEDDKAKVSSLQRRRAALANYLQSVLPASTDYQATLRAIEEIDDQILALPNELPLTTSAATARESRLQLSSSADGDSGDALGDPAQSDGIKIISPSEDETVHVSQYEVQVTVSDEDVDDIMVAVYTKSSGDKPAVAREMELKRSERGKKSFPVSLDEGSNRIEVSDLKRPGVKVTRTITYVPASDMLNAPPQLDKSKFTERVKNAENDSNAAVICGQLRLTSLNRTLALIKATPALSDLAERFRMPGDPLITSRLGDYCQPLDGNDGAQEAAVVDLLKAVLLRLNPDLTPRKDMQANRMAARKQRNNLLERTTRDEDVRRSLREDIVSNTAESSREEARMLKSRGPEFNALSSSTIRKQIVQLEQYLGNVEVRLMDSDGNVVARTFTDHDGNFFFKVKQIKGSEGDKSDSKSKSTDHKSDSDATATPTPSPSQSPSPSSTPSPSSSSTPSPASKPDTVEYTISTEGDDNNTKRKVIAGPGDRVRVNIDIEDRPVSLLVRTVVGYDQAGAASAKREQTYFVDFFISNTFPFKQKINPDFGERLRLWGDFRINSVPQPGGTAIGTFVSTFSQEAAKVQVKDVARVFEALGGFEYRLTGNNALLPSFDRQTKQKFSISAIGAFGIVTPLESSAIDSTPAVFKVFNDAPGLPPEAKGKDFVAFVPVDRDRFFRQYYAGLRVQTFFFNKYNIPMQRFPAQFDFTVGQNEFVTGGRFHGPVFRMEGYFPLPYEDYKFINLFASATMIPGHSNITTPLLLQPAPAGTVIQAPNVVIIPVPQPNRDYYRIGVGIDAIPFFQKLVQGVKSATGSGANAATESAAPAPSPSPTPSP